LLAVPSHIAAFSAFVSNADALLVRDCLVELLHINHGHGVSQRWLTSSQLGAGPGKEVRDGL
jgi:hypothetical protein